MSLPFNVQQSMGRFNVADPMNSDPGMFNLTWNQRLTAFGSCFILGLAMSIIGTVMIFLGHMAAFAVIYSLGNLISLFGMGFLVGFKRQLKMATAPVRLVAFLVYIGLLIATFVVAFTASIGVLCLIFAIAQYCALAWYSASYIPFGRKIIKSACGACASAI
ncbi:hypothetical protein LPJ59_001175 [Coemansia sp. RSA 2399]|nr:hypothetical protein LPJ59_001175 [Coemansia sp. RSA 2399]KAJ1906959.1 hypothetical protein LPJ81_001052 [Coemansia sp. IMI 209127]